MILQDMGGNYKTWCPNYSNFSILNPFHYFDGTGFEENFVRLVYSTMDLIAYHLLLGGGLPMHLRAAPKTKLDATGAKLVAREISNGKFREIDRIEEITTA